MKEITADAGSNPANPTNHSSEQQSPGMLRVANHIAELLLGYDFVPVPKLKLLQNSRILVVK